MKRSLLLFTFSWMATLAAIGAEYPNFESNPYLDDHKRAQIAPYLLPLDHPMRPVLDQIFSQSRIVQDMQTLANAGFEVVAGPMARSYVVVARHPAIPGYVFKMHLDYEPRTRKGVPHWASLVSRCAGAAAIREAIISKQMRYFTVPDKWLYVLPVYPFSNVVTPEPIVLIETDMEPEGYGISKRMWRTVVTRKHLDELYSILKTWHGGKGGLDLWKNVPFTKQGTFAFIDTEKPPHIMKFKHIKQFLSKDMQHYWDTLISK